MAEGKEPLNDLIKAASQSLMKLNELVPTIVVVGCSLGLVIIHLVRVNLAPMMAVATIIVLFTALLIYGKSNNYSEASFALVAGLLTVFSIEWNSAKFTVFAVVWLGFSSFTLMISSVRLAANLEEIYRQGALFISSSANVGAVEKNLRRIAETSDCRYLGPVESAMVIRLFCFRKLPTAMMSVALEMVEAISVVTKLDKLAVGDLVVDVFKAFGQCTVSEYEQAVERALSAIRGAPVSPEEFINAFRESRSWILSGELSAEVYFDTLVESFESGMDLAAIMSQATERAGNTCKEGMGLH